MKVLYRVFGVMVVGIYFIMSIMTLGEINAIETEANDITTQAMTQTQIAMREQIEDRIFNTDNARVTFSSSDDYINYFKENIAMLKTSDADYEIEVYAADIEKGLLSVVVVARYKKFDGTIGECRCPKTAIVDIIKKGGA
ncbi:MAG: hypothetical protein IJI66_02690 [Erysipelotrichaceae bacterium]|nr:hypothetical protein [Erysipelotrichaceae bacterium]